MVVDGKKVKMSENYKKKSVYDKFNPRGIMYL